jgi:hypothetical protein
MIETGQATQFQYNPLYKPNQLICGTASCAVITGWTVKGAIAKKLQPHEFAVIGQLYSPTRGISLLIRNLLVNPHVRFLVVLNATKEDRNAGGCQCLLDFFRNGFEEGFSDTGRRCWVIRSPITGYIDFEIDAGVLQHLRQSVECSEAHSTPLNLGVHRWNSLCPLLSPLYYQGHVTDIELRGGQLRRLGSKLFIELKQLERFDPLAMMGNGKS